ncbi:SusC/RagA family TonB-linked outer membrane protein [Myroides odoratimimus CCUG 12901]|uniref:SusC/RagA family TonB-linked outer membrane protein n=1 Tax=Myroides odoratimimus TaxID=76832 RepID=UPI0002460DAC|nr:SusC/RagA family TonB-linked outer membrane protein [Myroides odoratimimus]EHO05579.1 SusC/RagA family TonB-linked outer membrane protein [Myroides odoratimimus CCUG 12901]MCO7723268.1 SusC/RagA family TonB-linked outer membrane protein [Myroides odoratimimus]MDM1507375.1 SusC/RagA family TonB-linked outer membrane protein [Myroides odoratimimus]MDM1510914.1 SusC/RagA family TonB-linked outer membrane protein [Myroides odoratimimus]MDM1517638.1 SusC/RagA family TonB-linked outer membrane pr
MKKSRLNWFYASLLLLSVSAGYAQDKKLTGVVSEGGTPLPGVSVTIQGTNHGTQTDLDGNYSLNVKPGDVLVFSFIGMQDTTYKVGNANTYNVNLSTDENILDEVIVVGYGTATKESFSGSASQISSAQIEKKSVSNAVAALAGEAAGVRIINPTGQPGAEPTVRIRGFGSVNGNRSPLYIVDGVPYSGSISSINPADIGSMTVLKDATATAIYGSRGANGVIIINTKTGKGSKSFIEVEAKTGVNWRALPKYDKIESPETYIEYSYEALKNYGKIKGNFSDADATLWANKNLFLADYGIRPNYNMWNVANGGELIDPTTGKVRPGVTRKYTPEKWDEYAFQSSRRIEGNLNMGGSSDKTSYFSSIGYLKDEGYSVKSDYERLTARLNLQHKPKEWLDAKMNIGYTHSQSNNSGQASDSGSVFWFTDNIPSIYPLFLRDSEGNYVKDIYGGNQYDYGAGRGFGALTNSLGDVHYGLNRSIRDEINANASFVVDLYDGLTFETTIGGQYYNNTNNQRSDRFYGSAVAMKGSIYKVKSEVFSYNWTKMLRYKNVFGEHGLEALAAHENYSYEYRYNTMNKSGLADPNGTELNNASTTINATGYISDYTLESYFGQVNYDYANKYYLTGSIRRDGSSRFKENKWGTFASVGLSWVASKENFMLNQDLFSYLKFKTSYGTVGDQAVGSYYPGENMWQVDSYGGALAIYETSIGNPLLTWEKSKMFQVGVEFSLKQFLDVNIDYYIKNTDDLIFTRAVGPSAGYASMTVNDGKLLNKGLEFNVTGHLLKTKDAYIDLSINGEYLKNELKRMPIDPSTGKEKVLDVSGIYGRAKGHSLGDFYMREWAGVNSETGQAQWYTYTYMGDDGKKKHVGSMVDFLESNPEMKGKLTKETTTTYSNATLQHTGKSAIPKLRGGVNLSAGYKGWDLSVQMLYSLGGYAYDSAYAQLMGNDKIGSNNWHNDIANRWQKPGDITDVPRLSSEADTNVNSISTRFLVKSDYLAINNIRLGYTLPKTYVKQLGLADLSFFVSGDNLFLFTKRDGFNPAASEFGSSSMYQYPPLTTFTGGVKVKF